MTNPFSFMQITVMYVLIVCWLFLAFAFLFREQPQPAGAKKFDPVSIGGITLQILSFALVWGLRRRTDVDDAPLGLQIAVSIIAIAIAIGSLVVVFAAVRALGKRPGAGAETNEEAHFVKTGPFRVVRYPIYAGLLGMLVATGMGVTYANVLLVAVLLFLLGFFIRIRREDKFLRDAYGEEYEEYLRNVPPLIPRL